MNRLGERLANADVPADADVAALVEHQRSLAVALAVARAAVDGAVVRLPTDTHVRITQREKTIATIVDKLKRGTPLATMQDLVGVRLVAAVGLAKQDRLVDDIARPFDPAHTRRKDRREDPSHGYRAVHVVVTVNRMPVEIQVRTDYQHVWANANEWLADRWGRGIRYGLAPDASSAEELASRRAAIADWHTVSAAIARLERSARSVDETGNTTAERERRVGAAGEELAACLLQLPEPLRLAFHQEFRSFSRGARWFTF